MANRKTIMSCAMTGAILSSSVCRRGQKQSGVSADG